LGIFLLVLSGLARLSPAEITFDSAFECGNATAFQQVADNVFSFQIEPDSNSSDRQWFYFSVSGAAGQTLTFHLLNTDRTNVPSHWNWARPVASTDGGRTWELTTETATLNGTTYSFTHTPTADPEQIAFHYPYRFSDLLAHESAWESHPEATCEAIGYSVGGREISLFTITNPDSEPPEGKRLFWVIARQHAGEVTGSYMLEGFMDFLLSEDPRAWQLRDRAIVLAVPMVNPDGVVQGNYRDNLSGVNLNRAWDNPNAFSSPEVLAVRDAIHQSVQAHGGLDWFADLHSTSGVRGNFSFHAAPGIQPPLYPDPPAYAADLDEFLQYVASHSQDFDPDNGNSTSSDNRLAYTHIRNLYGVLSFTFEGGYLYPTYGANAGQYMTPTRHRRIGRATAIALQQYYFPDIQLRYTGCWLLH
jgi:murein tripeptide amidase MpaA